MPDLGHNILRSVRSQAEQHGQSCHHVWQLRCDWRTRSQRVVASIEESRSAGMMAHILGKASEQASTDQADASHCQQRRLQLFLSISTVSVDKQP